MLREGVKRREGGTGGAIMCMQLLDLLMVLRIPSGHVGTDPRQAVTVYD